MDNYLFFSEIEQSFVSDGNVFLKLVAPSGGVDSKNNDIKRNIVTLVIPVIKISEFSLNISRAAVAYSVGNTQNFNLPEEVKTIELGQPLNIPD